MGWVKGWRRRIAILGVALLGVATVVLPGTFAAGELETDNTFGSSGVLRLHLGTQDYFRFDPTGGGDPTQTNIVPTTGCKVGLSNGSLVGISVTPATGLQAGALGLVADGLGVRQTQEGNGTPCGQVNGTAQSMTIALAGTLATKVADRAELDIELKFNAKLKADMYLDGAFQQTQVFAPCTGSDCGPDSADGDNYRVTVSGVLFDAIKLSVDPSTPNGAFSLEGGKDATAPGAVGSTLASDQNDSIFRISGAEGVLNCGETVTETGGPGEPDATLQRLSNDGCEKILYSLDSSTDGTNQNVHFLKDIADQPNASFFVTITWDNVAAAVPIPSSQVDEGTGFYTPDWCDGTFANPSLPAGSTVHWCIRKETAELSATDLMQRSTYYFGFGDPIFQLGNLLG
jgi:hypothetical protein